MSLQTELDVHRAAWESRVGEAIAGMMVGDNEGLRASGILDRTLKAGAQFPVTSNLLDRHRKSFDLNTLIAQQPVILTFYRGGWCPYCNLELRAYSAKRHDIEAAGAVLVAVSPELPDHVNTTATKNDVEFLVLSDVGGELASALGIRFTLSDTVRPFYEKAGHALPTRNGDGIWALPMPATYVIARGGMIADAFIEPDYRKRMNPEDAVEVLRKLPPAI